MSNRSEIIHRDLFGELKEMMSCSHLGEIVSLEGTDKDPGRVKIRVFGVFDSKDLGSIPDEDLPYAYPIDSLSFGSKSGAGAYSAPKVGSIVRVVFKDDIYHPRYFSIEWLDEELRNEIKNDPQNFHSLLFDTDEKMKIFYSKKKGMMIDYNESNINIKPDGSIIITHRGGSAVIELRGDDIDIVSKNQINISSENSVTVNSQKIHDNGSEYMAGANPSYKMVNGEPLMILLKGLAQIIGTKLPIDPSASTLVQSMEQSVLSGTCKVSP
jgi:hypothetical protein|nr:MAG TPA: baseplate wedge protein [Ackermannviridae sp.]